MNNKQKKKVAEAIKILEDIETLDGSYTDRRRERLALTLLALANIRESSVWRNSRYWEDDKKNPWSLLSREIISFWNENYSQNISSGSYDDVRRKDIQILFEAGFVIRGAGNPNASTNTPTRRYALTKEAGELLRAFGNESWQQARKKFLKSQGSLKSKLDPRGKIFKSTTIDVSLPNGETVQLKDGPHNQLQQKIVKDFLPRFLSRPIVLYIGDADNKSLVNETSYLEKLGVPIPGHDQLPDIIAFDKKQQWLFFIEAVHTANPVTALRKVELDRMFSNSTVGIVYVSAFLTKKEFRKWAADISWETEAWIAENPNHMIHFNGERFLGPYS